MNNLRGCGIGLVTAFGSVDFSRKLVEVAQRPAEADVTVSLYALVKAKGWMKQATPPSTASFLDR